MEFPFGKAPLAILLLAICSGLMLLGTGVEQRVEPKPDLVYATFVKEHAEAYRPAIEKFEEENHVHIQVEVVDKVVVRERLQAALEAGADVPDMVELLAGTMGTFTRGPLKDVGFVDLTDRATSAHLNERLVASRFKMWSSRQRIFALPHDVHPVMLIYRRDLVEQLGIDVNTLTTWAEFERVGREVVTRDLDGDGVPDRYMIDLRPDGSDILRLLLLQRGVSL